jgi:hypothetical protein
MTTPNIIGTANVTGNMFGIQSLPTTATLGLPAVTQTNTLTKIESVIVTNKTASTASLTIYVGTGTTYGAGMYYVGYQIAIPPTTTLVPVDRTMSLFIPETYGIYLLSGTASAFDVVVCYETIL